MNLVLDFGEMINVAKMITNQYQIFVLMMNPYQRLLNEKHRYLLVKLLAFNVTKLGFDSP